MRSGLLNDQFADQVTLIFADGSEHKLSFEEFERFLKKMADKYSSGFVTFSEEYDGPAGQQPTYQQYIPNKIVYKKKPIQKFIINERLFRDSDSGYQFPEVALFIEYKTPQTQQYQPKQFFANRKTRHRQIQENFRQMREPKPDRPKPFQRYKPPSVPYDNLYIPPSQKHVLNKK